MGSIDREAIRQSSPLQEIIPALTESRLIGVGRERLTTCPFHEDHHPSLRVNIDKQTWYCDPCGRGGDVFTFVQQSLGTDFVGSLRWLAERCAPGNSTNSNVRPGEGEGSRRKQHEHPNTPSAGLPLAEYAAAKGLPQAFLQELGLSELIYNGRPAVRIPYLSEDGIERAIQFRLSLNGGEGERFRWKKGSKPCPYGLQRLDQARALGRIALVEGASDTQTLWFHNIPALGLPSASARLDELEHLVDGLDRIDVVIEPDRGGETLLAAVSRSAFRERVWLVTFGEAKDPSGLYLEDPEQFAENWRLVTESAPRWIDVDADERTERATANFRVAQELLDDRELMTRIADTIRAKGYAGEVGPALLAYVAFTSRLLSRPMNLAFVAQSAAGKNAAVNAAKDLIPPEAVHEIRASSERALIYDDVGVRHKTVIFSEADSIPEEGPAASAIRSLASDNVLAYDTVERNLKTGRLETRHIQKLGPTGLITTSTRSLRPQMSTRTLEVPIPDDPAQTREILRTQAAAVRGLIDQPDVAVFIAFQQWLADAGRREVTVPFATVLAENLPATEVRMRRDFPQLLACIQAAAFLHQRQRQIQDGKIIASITDYGIARELLSPIFDALTSQGCTPAVRDTVLAVGESEESVTVAELSRRLNRSKSSVSERAKRALRGGWLVNEETRRGYPARYRRGSPLPEETTALPTPAHVRELFGCSVQNGDVVSPPRPT